MNVSVYIYVCVGLYLWICDVHIYIHTYIHTYFVKSAQIIYNKQQ